MNVYGKAFIRSTLDNKLVVESVVIFRDGNEISISTHNKDIDRFTRQIKTADSAKEEKFKVADFVKDNTTFLKWLGTIIKNFVFKIGLILAMIIIMIEYTLTVIEFFIVMAMSILLIPMFFLDATKSFATNILYSLGCR